MKTESPWKSEIRKMKCLQFFIKRLFDIVFSSLLIVFLTVVPILLIVPILIKLTSKGPAIFKQERVGKNGKFFHIFKFRTMLIPEERIDENGNMRKPTESITKVGSFLRKTSIDELPQLFNILFGDMSIVGPRPMLPAQVAKISQEEKRRHCMRPGVTGLAQVNGRNNLDWSEKLKFDLQYVREFSLWLDIQIMVKTIKVVLSHEGIAYVKELDDRKQ
ncbi:MAG: sugar transferase [Clostridia bacterium]|nr:sugar transferase [Clostridia bacterium]